MSVVNEDNNRRAIFAQRLQNARKICGLSQAELVAKMEELAMKLPILFMAVSTTAIERYEKGIMFPESDKILGTIAEVLNTTITELLRPFTVKVDCSQFAFRKKAKLGKKAVEAIKLKIQQRIENYVEIERVSGMESFFDASILSTMIVSDAESARTAAMKLRQEWELGLGPIPQPISVLEAHGVKVIEVEEDPLLFDGTSNMVEGIPVLVLNKKEVTTEDGKHLQNEERRRLTLFHEFGHQVMHFSEDLSDKEKEDLCNVFANEMLIPSSTFRQIFGEKRTSISHWELKDVQREFGISARALMMKAVQLGVISSSKHKWFFINLNKNASLREALDETAVQVQHTSRFDRLVYRSLDSELITHSKAAQLLGISLSELKSNLNLNTANGYCS